MILCQAAPVVPPEKMCLFCLACVVLRVGFIILSSNYFAPGKQRFWDKQISNLTNSRSRFNKFKALLSKSMTAQFP